VQRQAGALQRENTNTLSARIID